MSYDRQIRQLKTAVARNNSLLVDKIMRLVNTFCLIFRLISLSVDMTTCVLLVLPSVGWFRASISRTVELLRCLTIDFDVNEA